MMKTEDTSMRKVFRVVDDSDPSITVYLMKLIDGQQLLGTQNLLLKDTSQDAWSH